MKTCTVCDGSGYRRHEGYCICDGWCHDPRSCESDWTDVCGWCKGLGFTGKVDVKCDACGAARKKPCKEKKRSKVRWYRPYWANYDGKFGKPRFKVKIHQKRHTKAKKLAKKNSEKVKVERALKKKRAALKELRKELREFDVKKKEEKQKLREKLNRLSLQLRETAKA